MKRSHSRPHPVISPMAAGILICICLMTTSCIYDRPHGDNFYRTLWASSEAPLEGLTIEFLCGGSISAQADSAVGSYGTYQADKATATFIGLTVSYDDMVVILEEGHKEKDRMEVIWHYSTSSESHTTTMHRLSDYR